MKKFEGILICTDLDGTLLCDDKSISAKNVEAIEYFKAEGGFFTVITGRVPQTTMEICKTVKPNAPIGCINGAGVYDWSRGEYIWAQTVPDDICELVAAVYDEIPDAAAQINTFGPLYFQSYNSAMIRFRDINNLPDLQKSCDEITEPITKIFFADDDEEKLLRVIDILSKHPKSGLFSYIRSEIDKYEILPKGISKGTALLKIAEVMGIDKRRTVAVGDYNNDIPMMQAASVGVAVGNACEEAKTAADYITVTNENAAIAKVIEDIENGKILI